MMVKVLEIPSCASLKGSLDTEDRDATAPWVSRPCIGFERAEMALHDRDVRRYFATGVAGLSIVADSLSAIKYAKGEVLRIIERQLGYG